MLLIGALVRSLPSVVPVWALIAGFAVSVGAGIFFGVWPAVKDGRPPQGVRDDLRRSIRARRGGKLDAGLPRAFDLAL